MIGNDYSNNSITIIIVVVVVVIESIAQILLCHLTIQKIHHFINIKEIIILNMLKLTCAK
jgi:hypothetical protein